MTIQWPPKVVVRKVTLQIVNGCMEIHIHGSGLQRGYSAIESVRMQTGKALPGMRQHAAKHAKRLGVPFEDMTA